MQSEEDLGMAATVAYEHHIMLNGGGYPAMHYKRECAMASRLVHVCDVYDALSTKRPYRDAWPTEKTMLYLEDRAGTEFDPDLVAAFIQTLRQGQAQVRVLSDDPPRHQHVAGFSPRRLQPALRDDDLGPFDRRRTRRLARRRCRRPHHARTRGHRP